MRRAALLPLLMAGSVRAAPAVPREPFANAHVSMMVRVQSGGAEARLLEVDVWAEGARLRALVRGEPQRGVFWVDGLAPRALRVVGGKIVPPGNKTLESALQLALAASPVLPHANTDRIAGRPCKILTESLPAGVKMSRCIWRGLPLSAEVRGKGFSFHAAATLVEEEVVTLADLQPPPGAPVAPGSLSAGR